MNWPNYKRSDGIIHPDLCRALRTVARVPRESRFGGLGSGPIWVVMGCAQVVRGRSIGGMTNWLLQPRRTYIGFGATGGTSKATATVIVPALRALVVAPPAGSVGSPALAFHPVC